MGQHIHFECIHKEPVVMATIIDFGLVDRSVGLPRPARVNVAIGACCKGSLLLQQPLISRSKPGAVTPCLIQRSGCLLQKKPITNALGMSVSS